MAPKKRTYSDVSESSDESASDNSSLAVPRPPFPAPSTPAATQNAPQPAPSLPMTTPTRPVAIPPLTKSQIKRQGMTSCGSPTGGPTPRGSSYGYEHRVSTDSYPDYRNQAQREEVERLRAAELAASASRQPGMSSTATSNMPNTPTPRQQNAGASGLSSTQATSSQQYSDVGPHQAPRQAPTFGRYGNTSLPRPDAGVPYGAFQPNLLPSSTSNANINAGLQPARSSAPTWPGSSYAPPNAFGGSDAPTRSSSRAAGLNALSNIPGDPGYNPPSVLSVFDGTNRMGRAWPDIRDDPFTSDPTTLESSGGVNPRMHAGDIGSQQTQPPAFQQPLFRQSNFPVPSMPDDPTQTRRDTGFYLPAAAQTHDVTERGLHASTQQTGHEANAPTTSSSDRVRVDQPSTHEQDYDWRVSPPPAWSTFVAEAGANALTQDALEGQEGYVANREVDQAQTDEVDTQSEHSVPERAQRVQAADQGDTDSGAQNFMESGMGSSSHAQEASSG